MLDNTVKMQWNMAIIMESKASESEKVRDWLCDHVSSESFGDKQEQLKQALEVHEQIVESLNHLTRIGNGMNALLKRALEHEDV
jgi:hypothetical protein